MKTYRSPDEDSSRWSAFAFREGDIVVSTRSKHGTTWIQMICALLIFGSDGPPARLGAVSPWLDWTGEPIDDVIRRLDAQRHRRVVKTHTPLDGIPIDDRVQYVVVARDPLDAAVSLYHQSANLRKNAVSDPLPPIDAWLREWIESDPNPVEQLDSLPGVMMHLGDAWNRRAETNVSLLLYGDLAADLDGAMRDLAGTLAFDVRDEAWAALVRAASFESMRAAGERLAPPPDGVLLDRSAFFRRGRPGAAEEVLTDADLRRYRSRASALASADLIEWLHRPPPSP
jgi:aryl sulfotransferase